MKNEEIFMFSLKPDYSECKKRYDAFWANDTADRPLVTGIIFPKEEGRVIPEKKYGSWKDKWLDIDHRVSVIAENMKNNIYYDDSMPVAFPNMGPEIFSAWCGCEYNFGETTTWSEPCIKDWEEDFGKARLDMEHPLFKKLEELTIKLLEIGRNDFITGLTDFHPGGDHLAALRDPENLAVDLIENPEWVKKKTAESTKEYFKAYDHFYNIIKSYDMPVSTWTPLIADDRYYVPSNDFSCMISNEMFVEFFLDGIIEECRFYDKSIYHLDGPGALRHLDTLLDIKELNAVQWVPGAGNESLERWMPVYKKIQAAKKSIQIFDVDINNLDLVFENLRPEGVWICRIGKVTNKEEADHVLKRVRNWK